jgi:hypothetical protein
MTTITIFDTANAEPTQNKTSRQLEYEALAKAAVLPAHNYRILYDMAVTAETVQVPNTTILSIMLKYLCRYVECIVAPDVFGIVIQCDYPLSIWRDGRREMWPSGKQIKVAGLVCGDLVYAYNRAYLRHYDYVNQVQLLSSGLYGLHDTTPRFTQQRPGFARPNYNIRYMFDDEANAETIIYKMVERLRQSIEYFNANSHMLTMYADRSANRSSQPASARDYPLGYNKKILAMLDNLQYARFGDKFYFDALFNLDRGGLINLYHTAEVLGVDCDAFKKEYAEKKRTIQEHRQFMQEVSKSYINTTNEAIKRIIALDKYNTDSLDSLDKQQRKAVELEFARRSIAPTENLDLKRAFAAMIDAQVKSFTVLKQAVAKVEAAGEIPPDLLALLPSGDCPHIFYRCKMILADPANPQHVRSYLIGKYAMPADSTGYYCKICGGKLAELDNATQISFAESASLTISDDPLQTAIYKETNFIINSVVRFRDLMPIKPLVSSIAAGLRGPLSVEETKLYRSKTAAADSINDTLNLYINIYIYAALCALMINNPGKIMFAREKQAPRTGGGRHRAGHTRPTNGYKYVSGGSVQPLDAKKAEALIVRQALTLLLGSKEIIISKLKNMSIALIKSIFGAAYKWALSHIKPIAVTEEQAYVYKEMDMIYDYAFLFKKASGVKLKYTDTEKILGRDKHQIETDRAKDILQYDTLPLADEIELDTKTPAGAVKALGLKYVTDSYNYIANYMRLHIYMQNVVPLHPQVAEFRERYAYLADLQAAALIRVKILKLRPALLLDFDVKNLNDFSKINMAQHYCPDGSLHKIGAYVYAKRAVQGGRARRGGNEPLCYTKKEIVEWLATGNKEKLAELASMRVIDEKCEKCSQLLRNIPRDTSNKAMVKLFNAQDNESAFYQYFDSRCPLGNLHEIKDNQCVKCGLVSGKHSPEYYAKYLPVFHNIQKEKVKISIESLKQKPPAAVKTISLDWKPSLKYTSELSQLSGVNYNIIINIGLTENVKWPEIEQSKINPSKLPYSFKARSLKFKSHILNLVRMFNMIKNHRNIVELPGDLKEVFGKTDLDALYAKVTVADFVDQEDKYRYALQPEHYCNFLQEFLAKFIIDICVGDVKKKLMECIMNQIIDIERKFSKADPFFFKPDVTSVENATSSESEKDANDAPADSSDDEEAADGFNNDGYDVEKADEVWEGD